MNTDLDIVSIAIRKPECLNDIRFISISHAPSEIFSRLTFLSNQHLPTTMILFNVTLCILNKFLYDELQLVTSIINSSVNENHFQLALYTKADEADIFKKLTLIFN